MINYFSNDELRCKHCDEYFFDDQTKLRLNQLRHELGFPITINSGYRCEYYNNQIGATQTHASGQAVDIKIRGEKAYNLIHKAIELGFTGIGIKQKGETRFIHLDDLTENEGRPRPWIWSY